LEGIGAAFQTEDAVCSQVKPFAWHFADFRQVKTLFYHSGQAVDLAKMTGGTLHRSFRIGPPLDAKKRKHQHRGRYARVRNQRVFS
jgi:hypothetical protein